MRYLKFTEVNQWEGETWRFWLPLDGNEDAIEALRIRVADIADYFSDEDGDDPPFSLDALSEVQDEAYVDHRVETADEDDDGYMAAHQKVYGVLDLTDLPDEPGAAHEALYKGGIRHLFRETASA